MCIIIFFSVQIEQEAPRERKPSRCLVLGEQNSLVGCETVYPNFPCVMSDMS